jgi:hypothetical protein
MFAARGHTALLASAGDTGAEQRGAFPLRIALALRARRFFARAFERQRVLLARGAVGIEVDVARGDCGSPGAGTRDGREEDQSGE